MTDKLNNEQVINWLLRAVVGLLVIWSSWMTTTVVELQYTQASVMANRFTAADGLELARQLLEMERSIRQDMPPEEWRERIYNLEECQVQLELGRAC